MLRTKSEFFKPEFILIAALAAALLFTAASRFRNGGARYVRVKDCRFKVEIADTAEERFLGLGKRKKICQNCGMLFEFSEKGEYPFCMRDMKFPLDIIWILDDNAVSVARDVPCKFKGEINPHVLADKVLELNAGTAEKCGIKKGDKVSFIKK